MFLRHGLKNTLRSWRRTLTYGLLIVLLAAMLGTSLGLSAAVGEALAAAEAHYATLGVVEYIGDGYPDVTLVDEGIREAAEALAALELENDAAVLRWDPEQVAMGYLEGVENPTLLAGNHQYCVLVVSITGFDSQYGTYNAILQETLYSRKELGPMILNVDSDGCEMEIGGDYILHGTFYSGPNSSRYFAVQPFESAASDAILAGFDTRMKNITAADGGRYTIDEDSPFLQIAQTYRVRGQALEVRATGALAEYLPFQQGTLYTTAGRMFTPEEEAQGAPVCLLSEDTAEAIGVGVGDQIQLAMATAEGAPLLESYYAASGWDYQAPYTVVGLFCANDTWNTTLFIPPVEALDMTANVASYTLGQLRLDNEAAQDYGLALELPARVRMTLYDQGYSTVGTPLKDMQQMVYVITAVCILVGLAFLVLFGYLLVYRQRRIGNIMLRVGARRRNVYTYFLSGAALVALPSALLGAWLSSRLSEKMIDLINSTVASAAGNDLRYSNSNLTTRLEMSTFSGGPKLELFLTIGGGVLLLALLSCLLFTHRSIKKRRKRPGFRLHRGGKTRSLWGGSGKYAWLSAWRGGFRSLVPLLAGFGAVVLFCNLTGSLASTRDNLEDIRTESVVRGYVTDVTGQTADNLMLTAYDVRLLSEQPGVGQMTVSVSEPYRYVGRDTDEGLQGPGPATVPEGSFAIETATAQFVMDQPSVIYANGITDAAAFLYSNSVELEFLEGYDESALANYNESTLQFGQEGELREPSVCIIPKNMAQEQGICLGDVIHIQVMHTRQRGMKTIESLVWQSYRVIGTYQKESGRDHIFAPLADYLGFDLFGLSAEEILAMREESSWRNRNTISTVESAVFRVEDSSQLPELKSKLAEFGYCEPKEVGQIRLWLIIEDSAYFATEKSVSQRLWYMERIFPAVYGLTEVLGLVLSFLLVRLRRKEGRIMRSVGASAVTAFASLFIEQAALGTLGVFLGCLAGRYLGAAEGAMALSGIFLGAWLLGAALASVLVCTGRVLKHRKED